MIGLFTDTPFFSDISEVIRLFADVRGIGRLEAETPSAQGLSIVHRLTESDGVIKSEAKVYDGAKETECCEYASDAGTGALGRKRAAKRASKISVYRALARHFQTELPWGSLTGIRPTKLLRDSERSLGEDGARALFLNEFDVSEEKYRLAKEIISAQEGLFPSEDDLDLYIGIPFCVSRCAYCSFASETPDVFKGAQESYVQALLREIEGAKALFEGKNVRSVYVGGGTPTALPEKLLSEVLESAAALAGKAKEFTVEAGRPDTITEEKLNIIRSAGAGRISVNAQTLNDATLSRIGRRHTAKDFFLAYEAAREAGFLINVDIIAGLPGETRRDFEATVAGVAELSPQNVTVHTLAIKRASGFARENMNAFPGDKETAGMTGHAAAALRSQGYRPYYMYRQKYMKGCLENVGYSREGHECLYNIDNMEELCCVAAFGAGAISKLVLRRGERIERAANIKDLRLYIANADAMAKRKLGLFQDGIVNS